MTTETAQTLKDLSTEKLTALLTSLEKNYGAAESLETFCRAILRLLTPWHLRDWIAKFHANDFLHIQATRDHGKSHFWSFSLPLWLIYRAFKRTAEQATAQGPIFIALVSYSEEQAQKNIKKIRQAIEDNPDLKHLLPTKKSCTWDLATLEFDNRCRIDSFGVGSSIRGGHYHYVIVDDPCKDHWTISIEQQKSFFFGVVLPAVRRFGKLIFVGTPVAAVDFLLELEKNDKFPCFKYPALNGNLEPLWPEQYTYDDLMKRKALCGSYMFAREYMLERVNLEKAPFKPEWIKYYGPEESHKGPPPADESPTYRVMTVDPSISETGDAMGVIITDTTPDDHTYIVYRASVHQPVRQNIMMICDLLQQYEPDAFGVETFVFQKLYAMWLQEEIDHRGIKFPIVELEKQGVRQTYVARVLNLQPKLEIGRLHFRRGEDAPLVSQILNWDPTSKTNTDDELVALAYQHNLWLRPTAFTKKAPTTEGTFGQALADRIRGYGAGADGNAAAAALWSDLGGVDGESDGENTGYIY